MKKIENDYLEKYGSIPKDEDKRFKELLYSLNLSNKARSMIFPEINRILNMKWKRLDFVIYLVPKPTPRPRHNGFQHIFYVTGAKDNKDIFRKFYIKNDLPMITTPCKFTCISYLPIPNSMSNLEKLIAEIGLIRPIAKPDWDNIGKTYSDMIQGTLLLDDSLIIDGVSKKYYSTKPRVEIHIEYMEEYDCKFNEKKIRKKVEVDE